MTTSPVAKTYVVWSFSEAKKRWMVGQYSTREDAMRAYEQIRATTRRVKSPCPIEESVDPDSNAALNRKIAFLIVLIGAAAYWYFR